MKKILYLVLAIGLIVPGLAFARGGGGVSGGSSSSFHSSPAPSFKSAPSSSFSSLSIGSSSRSSSSSSTSGYSSSFSSGSSLSRGSYMTGGTTNVYNGGSNFWFWMWLINHDNNNEKYKNDVVNSNEHFPYILILDKTAKDYMLVRYIGPDSATEKVSPQEAEGLSWLKGEINY